MVNIENYKDATIIWLPYYMDNYDSWWFEWFRKDTEPSFSDFRAVLG